MEPTLFGARVREVYPEPRTNALPIRTFGHLRWDLEVGKPIIYAGLVHAEYGKVLRLDIGSV
jgi:hypothetical protein